MKAFYSFLLLSFISISVFAQSTEIKGTIKDEATGETIIGATVLISEGKGAVTDLNGNYSIKVDSSGIYTLTVSYVGFEPQSQKVKVAEKSVVVNFSLKTRTLNEVEVIADVARSRETPVAFSTITQKQIQEELGTRDLPMVLNSTPGVYATEQGGGTGDARITIRGFDQRNVAVMVDGVPVNDMENGQVYWSNWDGLGDITRTMQVQRGLGASKLAIASVGGTINIITKGIDQKMGASIKQEVNNYGLNKTSFAFNSGELKGKWGVTLGGSRKWGNNWADGTFTDAWSYFFKIQKRFNKHLITLGANGAPQKHGQRYDRLPLAIYSKKMSDRLGINSDSILTSYNQVERGLRYNPNFGITDETYTVNYRGNPFPKIGSDNEFNERVNFYHKPQFNFSHFWSPNDKLSVSTVVYASFGTGGGTALKNSVARDKETGLLKIETVYNANLSANPSPNYNLIERPSNNYLRANHNDHSWYGLLSSWTYKVDSNLTTLFGIDARYYKGRHYQSVYDLMGGDYIIDITSDKNQVNGTFPGDPNFKNAVRRVGDKVSYFNDAIVMWGGAFAQAEYRLKKWTTFLTASVSETGYQRIDYYKKKDLVINGNTFEQAVGTGDALYYNGIYHITANAGTAVSVNGDTTFVGTGVNTRYIVNATKYTNQSAEARYSTTKQKWFLGYTVKGGANYNINQHHNVFMNVGYLNMAPRFNVVFDNNNKEVLDAKNQKVYAVEFGYGLHDPKYAANVNLYYTIWENKPPTSLPQVNTPDGTYYYNINGLDALHKGIEI
ncbi:MAG: carboxypeptidase-like regulatory domain-containing protein, partial [Bacteroidia bacterium]|nr:carboxypeptidase-like regulatory domain-containing protein [Bacteroidia bacterium]